MPVIHIFHHDGGSDIKGVLARVCANAAGALEIPAAKVWAIWHAVDWRMVHRPDWEEGELRGPIVRVFCRRSHSAARVKALMQSLRESLGHEFGYSATSTFVQVVRVDDEEVFNVA